MSFDPITLAMAKPKVIDLNAYGDGATIGDAILQSILSGGGSVDMPNVGSFWDDVNTNRPLKLKLRYTNGAWFEISGVVVYLGGFGTNVYQVSFKTLVYSEQTGLLDVSVVINNGAETNLFVKVTT